MGNVMRDLYEKKINNMLERRKNLKVGNKRNSSTPRKEIDHFATERLLAISKFVITVTVSVIFLGIITFLIMTA